MSNIFRSYVGYATEGQWAQRAAAELGITPQQFLDSYYIDGFLLLLLSADSPEYGLIHINFRGGLSSEVRYDPATATVTSVKTYLDGALVEEWSGAMTAQQYINFDWPGTLVYGSEQADYLWIGDGTILAGSGNDIVELDGNNAIAYGEAGQDVFDVSGRSGNHITLADYQPGEKIFFYGYESFEMLAQNIRGVEMASNGFTLNFGEGYNTWSLTILGTSVDQMRLEDLLFGQAGIDAVYAPVMSALGIV